MKEIIFISAKGCKDCKRMIKIILKYVNDNIFVTRIDSESEESIEKAIELNISEIPACYVNGVVFEGSSFDEKKLIDTLKNYE
jgi:NCAIR mutase (PurE)-related protein